MFDSALIRTLFNLLIVRGSLYLFPLFSLPILTRTLGVKNFGELSSFLAIQQYGILIVEFGYNLTGARDISIAKDRLESSKIFSAIILSRLIFSLVLLALLLCVSYFFPIYVFELLLCWLATFGVAIYPYFYLLAKEKTGIITVVTVVSRLVAIVLLLIFVKTPDDMNVGILIYSLNWLVPGVIGFCYVVLFMDIQLGWPGFSKIKSVMLSSVDIFISNIFTSVYGPLNILMLGYFSSPYHVGLFSAADKLRAAFQGLLQPISQALYPRVAKSLGTDKFISYWLFSRKVIISVAFMMGVILVAFGYTLIDVFLGNDYIQSYPVLVILSLTMLFIGIGIAYGQNYFVLTKQTQYLRKVYVASSVIHLMHMPVLTYFFMQYGAAISIVITEFIVASCFLIGKYKTDLRDSYAKK
ncbi:oligosaccharide flippase family protein [Klebsiella quasipneumoniae]|uniref:oligosaccharide flippase family protein n=1 Tax=Klebsiella quasipneumoniae TaxID=1463165 RepID=UPI003F6DBA64